ncbi:hypothetical protein AGOR_G00080430 [Albula goreensis]|uniref:Uncharacterized protein n=1 Tax=Albula goreensis TaxID=1534307 RepID=A0A8T3DQE3_9TELE|nr:hypothetical protein AGOR_G00080430 [Albula goreensis]
MEPHLTHEIELSHQYEEILKKRTTLLQEMESLQEQHKNRKKQQAALSKAANKRNAKLLEDLQETENRLNKRPLPHPDVISLETRYWACVEEKIPEWEPFLLGRGPSPARDSEKPRRQRRKGSPQDSSPTHMVTGLPPRSNMRSVI